MKKITGTSVRKFISNKITLLRFGETLTYIWTRGLVKARRNNIEVRVEKWKEMSYFAAQ